MTAFALCIATTVAMAGCEHASDLQARELAAQLRIDARHVRCVWVGDDPNWHLCQSEINDHFSEWKCIDGLPRCGPYYADRPACAEKP